MTDSTICLEKSEVENATVPEVDVEELLLQCRKAWYGNAARDLEARHKLGKLLNERLGPIEKRQPYGAEAVKKIAIDLKMSRSELTRMRQFAAKHPNFAEFRNKSGYTNWTEQKRALVKSANKKRAKRKNGGPAVVLQLTSRVRNMTRVLDRDDIRRDVVTNAAFRKELQALFELAGRYLKSELQPS